MFGETWQSTNSKQIVSSEELLISLVVQQKALTGLLVGKGIFTREEFLEMVRVVDKEMRIEGRYIVGEVYL